MRAVVSTHSYITIVDDGGLSLGCIEIQYGINEMAAILALRDMVTGTPIVGQKYTFEAEQLPMAYKSWLESEQRFCTLKSLLDWLEYVGISLSTPDKERERDMREGNCLA